MSRFILKCCFHILRFFLLLFFFINKRTYMNLYVLLLKKVGCKISGMPRFISHKAYFDDFNLIKIGNRVVISANTIFLTHDYSYTTGLISIGHMPKTDIGTHGCIEIRDNVFIGMNVLVLPNTIIEENVVIGAGSVVKGKICANSIYAGNPAKKIADIFSYVDKINTKENIVFIKDKK